jgi:hypothetical protein
MAVLYGEREGGYLAWNFTFFTRKAIIITVQFVVVLGF